jgi:hypothetical protein
MSAYQLTDDPSMVVDLSDGARVPIDSDGWRSQAYAAWLQAGNTPRNPPTPTLQELIAQFIPGMQAHMDGVARKSGYDSVLACVSYATSGVAQWRADAEAMVAWRDAMWTWAYTRQDELASMSPAELSSLTIEQIIERAPKAADFGWMAHAPGAGADSDPDP